MRRLSPDRALSNSQSAGQGFESPPRLQVEIRSRCASANPRKDRRGFSFRYVVGRNQRAAVGGRKLLLITTAPAASSSMNTAIPGPRSAGIDGGAVETILKTSPPMSTM